METKKPKWVTGYKEVRNIMHNEMDFTKEQMSQIIEKIAREEVKNALGLNGEFVQQSIKDVVRVEMHNVLINEHYPQMRGSTRYYDQNGGNPFNKYISQIMKEEVIEMMRTQFDVGIEIKNKEN